MSVYIRGRMTLAEEWVLQLAGNDELRQMGPKV